MADNSQAISIDCPATLVPGEPFQATVVFRNIGDTVWSAAGNINLGSESPRDNFRWGVSNRHMLPPDATVQPGQEVAFTFDATAPVAPGNYTFAWGMVHDFVAWFGPIASKQVTVQGDPPPPPPQPQPPAQRSDPMDLTSFQPFPYFVYPAANDAYTTVTWANTSGRTLKVRKAYLWTGIDLGGVCDTDVSVRRASDQTLLCRVAWDHYAQPTAESGKVFDFGDNYITILPGESLTMTYMTNGFGNHFNAAHICELWVEG